MAVGIAAVIIGLNQGPQYDYETAALQKISLDASLIVSGVVKSASARNIYAPSRSA